MVHNMTLVPVLCCKHQGNAGIELISIPALKVQHFKHPTNQVVNFLDVKIFAEMLMMLMTLTAPASYCEPCRLKLCRSIIILNKGCT